MSLRARLADLFDVGHADPVPPAYEDWRPLPGTPLRPCPSCCERGFSACMTTTYHNNIKFFFKFHFVLKPQVQVRN